MKDIGCLEECTATIGVADVVDMAGRSTLDLGGFAFPVGRSKWKSRWIVEAVAAGGGCSMAASSG